MEGWVGGQTDANSYDPFRHSQGSNNRFKCLAFEEMQNLINTDLQFYCNVFKVCLTILGYYALKG